MDFYAVDIVLCVYNNNSIYYNNIYKQALRGKVTDSLHFSLLSLHRKKSQIF